MRTEPAMSLPNSSEVRPAASAAAEPPDEPPGVRVRSHGLLVAPKRGLYAWRAAAIVGVLVLPKITAPAERRRLPAVASRCGTWSARNSAPQVVRSPPVS